MKTLGCWIEAMRLRTLPVSVAGVLAAWAWAVWDGRFDALPAALCLAFAVLAQIASNFANEYYDFTAGRDRRGREGPRRGVTEGDITPRAMRRATLITLGIASCTGLSLVAWGGWWLIAVGLAIAVGVFAYSTGPYPLSTHGWGEVAVVFFFGLIPVNLTYYLSAHQWSWAVFACSWAIGLLGANVLIVNNYRDIDDDRAVGKLTLCVRLGRRRMAHLYAANVIAASALSALSAILSGFYGAYAAAAIWLIAGIILRLRLTGLTGAALTPLLAATSVATFAGSLTLLVLSLLR